jgi:hypothetical protein
MSQDRTTPTGKQPRSGVSDLAALGLALAVAVVAGITGYTMALDDTKATSAATAASLPRVTVTAPGKTVTIPGPPLATVTATISVERKPREKSKPMPTKLTTPGKYAVGKDMARGQWISKLAEGDEAGVGCSWYVFRADGEVIDMSDMLTNGAPQGYTGPTLNEYATRFEFDPGCAPFELVR